jgi:hypothetical protein
MSYDIFKQNMLTFMRNQPNIASKEQFAKKLVQEYDALIKRGFDTLNGIPLQQGNTALMEDVLNGVLNTAFQQSSGEHAIITNMGRAFQAYWTPSSSIGGLLGAVLELIQELTEEDQEEAKAIITDITVEYPKTQIIYNSLFTTREERLSHNKNVDREEVLTRQRELQGGGGSGSPSPSGGGSPSPSPSPSTTGGGGTDAALKEKCGNGFWPALGTGPSPNFEVSSTKSGKTWYKQNPAFIKQNCTQTLLPTKNGDISITIHKDLAAVINPAIEEIRQKRLEKFIENFAGGLAVRQVTGGTRLSNHAWGTAIDINSIKYPYGYKFANDGIYLKIGKDQFKKIRNLDDFDKGFLEVAEIFKSKGMTWLRDFDPMHVSIYE